MMIKSTEKIKDLGIILAAGGSSTRFSGKAGGKSKLLTIFPDIQKRMGLAEFANMPLFMISLISSIEICPEENFVIVVKKEDRAKFADIIAEYLPEKKPKIVVGGVTRMHSVFNGLEALSESVEFAAIHDAARPFMTEKLFRQCINAARKHNGAVTAKRMIDTVKLADKNGFIIKTIDRNLLWRVETPQIFPKDILINAYKKAFREKLEATDDAGVMEYAGYKPFLFEHTTDNRKITHPIQ
jgi:2-C-methyl-D-erythritol 4-phosphate cytidylyltransferase